MTRGFLRKCLLILCVFVMACPHRSHMAPQSDQSGESQKNDAEPSETNVWDLLSSEPGFDLTNEEKAKFKIWPRGVIPYYIDDVSFDKVLRERIRSFLDKTNDITGLRFTEILRPPTDKNDRYVFFINRIGLLDCPDITTNNFTIDGVQRVVLGYDCLSEDGNMASLVLALAGVPPQHNAPDRDTYIIVQKDNIMPDKLHLFANISNNEWLFHDIKEYDYDSAGHYDFFKYTVNGQATIIPNVKFNQTSKHQTTGEEDKLSYLDVWKIRMLYNYISKKRDDTEVIYCSKLFNHPSNFKDLPSHYKDKIKPRPKSAKYLGIIDDGKHSSNINPIKFKPPGFNKG